MSKKRRGSDFLTPQAILCRKSYEISAAERKSFEKLVISITDLAAAKS
mgnify:CR=1 FL=1